MGNKIITEKDFWMCTTGAVPAQLQGTRLGTKKKSGEVYITVEDKATSSFIDFGCTKYMLLAALAVAAAVVVLAVVGVLTVATGGAALIALGAVAGLVGAAIGGIVGGLLCGQKVASKRVWSGNKSNLISQGTKTITGDHTMTCAAGGTITFAPQIKNWSQAVALGGANYLGKLMEGMMAGAAVGMGGAILSGGAGAVATGGMRGLGQATLQFAKSMPKNFVVNAVESVSKFGLALRGVMGVQNTAQTYGNTGDASIGDFAKGTVAMETGAYDSAKNIGSGNGTWQDYVGMAMMVAPVGQGKRDLEDSFTNKADEAETTKTDDAEANKVRKQEADAPKKEGDGEAYEAEPIFRQDNSPNSPKGAKEGRIKSHVNEDGNLVPANKDGTATIQDHVRGSEPKKSDSPYTSFSEGKPGVGKKYGDNVIELDTKSLEADIANGNVKDVEIVRAEQVQAELQNKIDLTKQKYESNPTPKNLERLQNAERDLSNTIRDNEVLIKGEVPSKYIKVYPNN